MRPSAGRTAFTEKFWITREVPDIEPVTPKE